MQQQSRAIIERFGRYLRTAKPGLNLKVPYIDRVVMRVSLRVQQLPVEVETKTADNVFVKLFVAVQFRVVEGNEADSYYKLQDHVEQIKSYVLDVVRAKVPKMSLDEVFEKKDDVGLAVKNELDVSMKSLRFRDSQCSRHRRQSSRQREGRDERNPDASSACRWPRPPRAKRTRSWW